MTGLVVWVVVGCSPGPVADIEGPPRVRWPRVEARPNRTTIVGLHLGEKTTCFERSDSRFECFGALQVRGAQVGQPLQVTDRAVCMRDGTEERCHEADGRVQVRPTPFVEVRVGGALCGRDPRGGVWCWTSREPDEGARITPIPVGDATALATTGMEACALTATGDVECFDPVRHVFGFGRRARTVGRRARMLRGTYLQQCWATPQGVECYRHGRRWRVPGVGAPRLLAVGLRHGCAVDDDAVRCWGDNRFGQRTPPPLEPALVRDLAAGDDHTCALLFGGRVECWGRDDRRQVTACGARACN